MSIKKKKKYEPSEYIKRINAILNAFENGDSTDLPCPKCGYLDIIVWKIPHGDTASIRIECKKCEYWGEALVKSDGSNASPDYSGLEPEEVERRRIIEAEVKRAASFASGASQFMYDKSKDDS